MTSENDAERQAAVHALETSFSELLTTFRRYIAEAAERVSPGMLPATFKTLSVVSRFGPITRDQRPRERGPGHAHPRPE